MMASQPDTDELLRAAVGGDRTAGPRLLARHRTRLRQMVAVYLDRRLAARIDPSDVVQEALADAAQGLNDYLRERPLPFYPWLRQFAWQRLLQLHRHHIRARRRSVDREEPQDVPLPDRSAGLLADRLLASGTSPSRRMIRDELCRRVREALDRLALILDQLGRKAESGAAFRRAIERQERLVAEDPREPACRQDLAASNYRLGSSLRDQGFQEDGVSYLQTAIRLAGSLVDDFPRSVGIASNRPSSSSSWATS